MSKTKKIYDEVYNELIEEFDIENSKDKPKTLDQLEHDIGKFGKELERRILEKAAQVQADANDKKKAVKNAVRKSKTSANGKE